MGRFQRSIELAKASWSTLKADRELLSLPVFSFLVAAAVLAAALGLVFVFDYDASTGFDQFEISTVGYIVLAIGAIVAAVVSTFFQAAMVGGARERLTGGDPTVSSALATARGRLGVIVPWAIFAWTVGAVLRAIEQRVGFLGQIMANIAGAAFNIVTFLAVPVLVVEEKGPIDTLKRCGQLFRNTWGENLAGQFGLGILSFVALLPGLIVGGLVGAAVSPILGVIIAVPWIALVLVVSASLTAIYQTALYEYATTGLVPRGFEGADFPGAFNPR